jgi:hypothetical protein
MAFPVGVSVAIIEAGRAFTSVGSDVSMSAKVTPVFRAAGGGAMKRIVHAATGHPMLASTEEFKAEAGSVLSFAVPHVDQSGWQAPSGEAYTMWYYAVEITARVGNGRAATGHVWKQNVQPLVGQDFIDLDLIADGPTGEPVTAPQAYVTDVEGQTGSVVIGPIVGAAIDQAVLDGRIPMPTVDVVETSPGVYDLGSGAPVYGLTSAQELPTPAVTSLDSRYAPVGALTEVPDAQVAAIVANEASATVASIAAKFAPITGSPNYAPAAVEAAAKVYTVAAVDTPMKGLRADYVCDGVDDLYTIQQALDALPDSPTVSGEVVVLPGTYTDASGITVSISSPTDGTRNVKKVLRFQRGARLNVSGRSGRGAVFKIESSFCQIINPEIAGTTPRLTGSGTAIAFGGPAAVLGGRYSRAAYFSSVHEPVIRNFETGVEFGSVDGVASTGDCYGLGGMIENCVTGVRAAGYVNRWYSLGATYCDRNIWVESRRVEAQLDVFGSTLTNWYEAAIVVDGGAGSHFHDTWMEHTLSTGPAQEAVRIGLSNATRASLVRFSGKTLVQLNTESYAFRLVGSAGLTVEDLQVSTSGITPSVSIIRNETSVSSKGNRFQRITFGPSTTPAHTLITGTGTGQVYVDRAPVAGAIEYTNARNRDTATQEHPFIVKNADESYLGNANMHNDTELVVTAQGGNSVYLLTGFIRYEADPTGDIKGTIQPPAGAVLQWQGLGAAVGATSAEAVMNAGTYAHNVEVVYGGVGAGVPLGIRLSGYLTTGTTGGTVRWRWAQGTANGSVPSKVLSGSWLKLEKID